MTPELANKINLYLNKPEITELIRELAEYEISLLQKTLEFSKDFTEVRYIQGRIFELRKLQNLRQSAMDIINTERASRQWQSEQSKP